MLTLSNTKICTLILTTVLLAPSYASAGFVRDGTTVIYGRGDTIFKVCNHSDRQLHLAFVYEHIWKLGEDPTWPVKGWYSLSRTDCKDVAVNGLVGVMSVMYKDSSGDLQPYYRDDDSNPRLANSTVRDGQSELIQTEYLCIGEGPYEGYKDNYPEYYECDNKDEKVPFQVVFNAFGRNDFTLTLN